MEERKRNPRVVHFWWVGALLIISILSNIPLPFDKVRQGDIMSSEYLVYPFIRETVMEYGQFPHWIPTYLGGMPFFANSLNPVLYLWNWLFLLIPISVEALVAMRIILIPFIGAALMYLLMINLRVGAPYAFISGLFFMLPTDLRHWSYSWQQRLDAVSLLPLVFLCLYKAVETKEWLKYGILTGIVVALQFHTSGLIPLLFTFVLFFCYYLFRLVSRKFARRAFRITLVSVVVGLVFFGLIAIKLFPLLEFSPVSSKQGGFSYAQYIGKYHDLSGFNVLRELAISDDARSLHIGFTGTALLLFSLTQFRKRRALFFWFLAIFTLFIAGGTILNYPFWRFVPGWDAMHHVKRASFLFFFAGAALVGIMLSSTLPKLKKKYGFGKNFIPLVIGGIAVLMVLELGIPQIEYQERVPMDFKAQMAANPLMNYLGEQPGVFRVHNIETSGIGGWAQNTMFNKGIHMLYGTIPAWIPEYMNVYLSVGLREPAKFWGMLNTKYVYSRNLINNSQFPLIRKFAECEICMEADPDYGIDGPYLYNNTKYLPRAYLAQHGILVVGDTQAAKQTMYSVLLDASFHPANTALVVHTGKVHDLSAEKLSRYDIIILTQGSLDERSSNILAQYTGQGGMLLPDVTDGKDSFTPEEFALAVGSLGGDYAYVDAVQIDRYTPNQIEMMVDGEKGFVVLSEKFYMFEGWRAYVDGKEKEIEWANGIQSAVYVDSEVGELVVTYQPWSFRKGFMITSLTLVFIAWYFTITCIRKKKAEKSIHS